MALELGNLFDEEPIKGSKAEVAKKLLIKRIAKVPRVKTERGCAHCPQNSLEGIKKLKGLVKLQGRKIMVWARNPDHEDNDNGVILSGKSGQLFWRDAQELGLTRDMCDVQYVVRCRTPKEVMIKTYYGESELKIVDHEPSKDVAYCCSEYTEEALKINGGKATVHLVLGKFAAKQLLGREYRDKQKMFWSQNLSAWVLCTYDPAYFNYGAPQSKREQFRAAIKAAKDISEGKNSRFAFIESQDYKEHPPTELNALYQELLAVADKGIRIVVDIEDGTNDKGEPALVMVGFSYKAGHSRSVFYDHPEANPKYKDAVKKFFIAVFTNERIKKAMHHGSYDAIKVNEFFSADILGYDYDTNYAEYLAYSDRKAYGLAAIADARFPKFSGYKQILEPYYDEGTERWNAWRIPKKILVLYNGADCDLAKRIEITTKKVVNPALMQVFVHCGFVLDEMQPNGPLFDKRYFKILERWVPTRLEIVNKKLQTVTKNPKFNPNSPKQVYAFLYDVLKLDRYLPEEWTEQHGKNTRKDTMELLIPHHPFPALQVEARRLGKLKSTYMEGFRNSAEMHSRVRTNWWLTGTVTGRLRSGGKKEGEGEESQGIVNLQNIDGAAEIECMLISDPAWWNIYEDWKQGISCDVLAKKYADTDVFCGWDQSQLEIRILAQMSRDPLLIKATMSEYDIHSSVGHLLTGIPTEKIKKDRVVRTIIKGLHFGIVFGLTPDNLYLHILASAREAGIKAPSKDEVLKAYNKYFDLFAMVKPFMESQVQHAEKYGFVQTLFGFRREVFQGESGRGSFWKNQAINSPVQGTAHNLMLIAFAVFRTNPQLYKRIARLCMEIHDALYSFVKLKDLPEARKEGIALLTTDALKLGVHKWWPKIDWKVGLQVEAKAGYRLGVLCEYEGESTAEFIQKWCTKNKQFNIDLNKKVTRDLKEAV